MKSSEVYFAVEEQDGVTHVTLCPKSYWDNNKHMNDDSSWLFGDAGTQAALRACGVEPEAEVVEGTWEATGSPKDVAVALRAAGFAEDAEFTHFISTHPE